MFGLIKFLYCCFKIMDNAGKARPKTGIDHSSENHDEGIPKVNVKFDGYSWTNQNPPNSSPSTSAALAKISSGRFH